MSISAQDLFAVDHVEIVNRDRLRKRSFARVSTDTRTLRAGDLFIALRGNRADGHNFVQEAFAKGAACAMVDAAAPREIVGEHPAVIVPDTIEGMSQLAGRHRNRLRIPVIAIAGSNGKTTTKEMVSAVLRRKYAVHQTMGNLNNHIGVPLTIFGLTPRHEVAVVEIGTNHFGEVRKLCTILRPTHALITNVGGEHLEFFESLEGVAREEGDVFRALAPDGTAFVNIDDRRVVKQGASVRRKVTYGFTTGARIRGEIRSLGTDGCALCAISPRGKRPFMVQVSLPGRQNASNALAAAAVGLTLNVPVRDIQAALCGVSSPGKRMEILHVRGVTILNDTYNANGDSTIGALGTLREMTTAGKKVVILGDMLELGASSPGEHARVGRAVSKMGFRYLLTYGAEARRVNDAVSGMEVNLHFDQKNQLAEYACELLDRGDTVLVKGSRGMRMEDVVLFLQERVGRKPV